MNSHDFDELARLLSSSRSGERLRALDAISAKLGGRVVRLIDDARTIPLLIDALSDTDRRVQRAAARGLRPWLADDLSLIDSVLASYAAHSFDGSYSHAGLYDTRSGTIWVPRFAALKGHAALLPDANTDRFFRFEFFVPRQAPGALRSSGGGHLLLYFLPEWSYSQQQLIPSHDERRTKANRREQERFGEDVVAFYSQAALTYDVHVHHFEGGGGHHPARTLDVEAIPAAQA